MTAEYATTYTDVRGTESTVVSNDGNLLRARIRGVDFEGGNWADMEPAADCVTAALERFDLRKVFYWPAGSDRYTFELANFTISSRIPILLLVGNSEQTAELVVEYVLDDGTNPDAQRPFLTLQHGESTFRGVGRGTFERAFLEIQRQLPESTRLKCCFGCALSSYHPYGDGEWGMTCYRNHKQDYASQPDGAVKAFVLHHGGAQEVQEIYLCHEFQPWDGASGYRDPVAPYTTPAQSTQ